MKFVKSIKQRYYKDKNFQGEIYSHFEDANGNIVDKLVIRLPRKKQYVRKDAVILKEFVPGNGDSVFEKLRENPHPNVMGVYDFDDKFIWAEFIDGPMLYHTYDMEPKEHYRGYDGVEFWFPKHGYDSKIEEGMTSGLSHLHSIGIYHGDMKPNNVVVAPDGTPKLVDFFCSIDASPEYVDYKKDYQWLKKTIKGLEKFK